MTALPGFIKTDQAYAKIFDKNSSISYAEAVKLLDSAIKDFENAGKVVDYKHPVQMYLQEGKLVALRNLQLGVEKLIEEPAKRIQARSTLRTYIKKELISFKRLFNNDSKVAYWENTFGVKATKL